MATREERKKIRKKERSDGTRRGHSRGGTNDIEDEEYGHIERTSTSTSSTVTTPPVPSPAMSPMFSSVKQEKEEQQNRAKFYREAWTAMHPVLAKYMRIKLQQHLVLLVLLVLLL